MRTWDKIGSVKVLRCDETTKKEHLRSFVAHLKSRPKTTTAQLGWDERKEWIDRREWSSPLSFSKQIDGSVQFSWIFRIKTSWSTRGVSYYVPARRTTCPSFFFFLFEYLSQQQRISRGGWSLSMEVVVRWTYKADLRTVECKSNDLQEAILT